MDVLRQNNVFIDCFSARDAQKCKRKLLGVKNGQSDPTQGALRPLLLLTHFHGDSTSTISKGEQFAFVLAPAAFETSRNQLRNCTGLQGTRVPEKAEEHAQGQDRFRRCLRPGEPVFRSGLGQAYPFKTEHCENSLGFWFPRLQVLYVGDSRVSPEQIQRCQAAVQQSGHRAENVRYVVGDGVYRGVQARMPSLQESARMAADFLRRAASVSATSPLVVRVICYHSGVLHFVRQLLTGAFPSAGPLVAFRVSVSDPAATGYLWKPGMYEAAVQVAESANQAAECAKFASARVSRIPESQEVQEVQEGQGSKLDQGPVLHKQSCAAVHLKLDPQSLGKHLAFLDSQSSPQRTSSQERGKWTDVSDSKNLNRFLTERGRKSGTDGQDVYLSCSSLFFAVNSDLQIAGAVQCANFSTGHLRVCTCFHATPQENRLLMQAFPEAKFESCPSRPLFRVL